MVGRVVMRVLVLGLAFSSLAEGRTSSSRGGDDGSGGGGGGGDDGEVSVKLNNRQACLGLHSTVTTTTFNTTHKGGKATLGTITTPDSPERVNCQWVIVNPKRKNLLLSFTHFNLSAGRCSIDPSKCCYEWLIVNPNTAMPARRRSFWQLNHYHSTRTPQHQPTPHHSIHVAYSGSEGGVFGAGKVCPSAAPRPVVTQASRVYITYHSAASVVSESVPSVLAPPSSSGAAAGVDVAKGSGPKGFTLQFYASDNSSMCEDDEFPCYSPHLCLPLTWLCDDKVQCPDESDEDVCRPGGQATHKKQKEKMKNRNATSESCAPDEWWCGMGRQCYSASQRCDGTLHCGNGMDELSCHSRCHRQVACWGWGCYMLSQRCDGSPDCGDASDEDDCSPELCNAQHGTFLCNNRRCIRDSWRCDQLDDCRDGSDEQDCLRNSVIGVAAMGGLACSLLLVVAVGCTGRLYALRMGLTRIQGSGSRSRGGGVRGGGPASSSHTPRSRLEEHLMQREMPPPYDVAVSDHSTPLFGTCVDWQQWRRQHRRPSVPPESANTPSRLPSDPHHPQFHGRSSHGTQGLAVEIQPGGRRDGGEEKVEERGGDQENSSSTNGLLFSPMHEDGDVPLLTSLLGSEGEGEGEEGDDVPLLDTTSITSASTSTSSSSTSSSICEDGEDEDSAGSVEDRSDVEEEEDEEDGDKEIGKPITLPLLPDLLHLTPQPLSTPTGDKTTVGGSFGGGQGDEVSGRRENASSPASQFTDKENEGKSVSSPSPSSSSAPVDADGEGGGGGGGGGGGDLLGTDTRAAVLALSAVQTHMKEMNYSDTEMKCQ